MEVLSDFMENLILRMNFLIKNFSFKSDKIPPRNQIKSINKNEHKWPKLKWENNSIQYGSNGAVVLWILMNVKAKAIFYEWIWMMVQNKIFLGQLTVLDMIDINDSWIDVAI